MQLDSKGGDFFYPKQQWVEFRLNKQLLTAYTIVNNYVLKEELQETIELLAYENECDISSIKVSKTFR